MASSSGFLNDNETVDDFERFLPRLYWLADGLVAAGGGEVVKWTGDGFFAWFPTLLDRHRMRVAEIVLSLAWHLTVITNLTQLDLKPRARFTLRHGITYEPDGLVIIKSDDRCESRDIVGRDIVLAFRLAGAPAAFPNILTQQHLLSDLTESLGHFDPWLPTPEEQLQFFKGEDRGFEGLVRSSDRQRPSSTSTTDLVSQAEEAIASATEATTPSAQTEIMGQVLRFMAGGPAWAKAVRNDYIRYVREDLLETLETVVQVLKDRGG